MSSSIGEGSHKRVQSLVGGRSPVEEGIVAPNLRCPLLSFPNEIACMILSLLGEKDLSSAALTHSDLRLLVSTLRLKKFDIARDCEQLKATAKKMIEILPQWFNPKQSIMNEISERVPLTDSFSDLVAFHLKAKKDILSNLGGITFSDMRHLSRGLLSQNLFEGAFICAKQIPNSSRDNSYHNKNEFLFDIGAEFARVGQISWLLKVAKQISCKNVRSDLLSPIGFGMIRNGQISVAVDILNLMSSRCNNISFVLKHMGEIFIETNRAEEAVSFGNQISRRFRTEFLRELRKTKLNPPQPIVTDYLVGQLF